MSETTVKNFKINYLTKTQYDTEKAAGRINEDELYLTPTAGVDVPSALSELTDDSTHRLVTDAEKSAWNSNKFYKCTYGSTTATEIQNALNANLIPIVIYNNRAYTYAGFDSGTSRYRFNSAFMTTTAYWVWCSGNSWSSGSTELQQSISDLTTIRNGAELGATALQSYTETDPTVPSWAKQNNKPTYTATEVGADPAGSASAVQTWVGQQGYQTATQVQTAIGTAIGEITEATSVSGTLLASSWSNQRQTISVSGVTSDTIGSIGVAQTATSDQFNAALNASIRVVSQTTGSIVVEATGTAPTINIPVEIIMYQ